MASRVVLFCGTVTSALRPRLSRFVSLCGYSSSSNPPENERLASLIPWSDTSLDAMERVRLYSMFATHNFDFSQTNIRRCLIIRQRQRFRERQRLTEEQIEKAGLDLAVAQMVLRLGGAVQFMGSERWFRSRERGLAKLPRSTTEGDHANYRVESIDLSGTPIMYEGLSYIRGLTDLRHLLLRNCAFVDDFCLARLQALRRSLLYLDLSFCPLVSARGLGTLWCMNRLRRLILEGTSIPELAEDKELVCLLLEERQPQLTISGVDFQKGLESVREDEALAERSEAHRRERRQLASKGGATSQEAISHSGVPEMTPS